MTLFGLGTEIVEVARIARMIERHDVAFLRRVFTVKEIQQCQSQPLSTEHFAASWAGKVAILKSLGLTRPRQASDWLDFEILENEAGKPIVQVGGASKDWLVQLRLCDLLVSNSHTRHYATATALAFVDSK